MTRCIFQTLTDTPWHGCVCKAKTAECRAPDRQHPKTPPFDPAGFHSQRVMVDGIISTEYLIVNSRYCTEGTCKSYKEG